MDSFMAWIGNLIGTAVAGPGAVVLGDPALDADPEATDEPSWSPLTYRVVGLALALGVLVIGGAPWQVVGVVALVGAVIIGLGSFEGRPRG